LYNSSAAAVGGDKQK